MCQTFMTTTLWSENMHTVDLLHDDVIKWKHFPRYWPFVREIHRSPVYSLHKGQWHGALMISLICIWINNWDAGDLRRHRAHNDVTPMWWRSTTKKNKATHMIMRRRFCQTYMVNIKYQFIPLLPLLSKKVPVSCQINSIDHIIM